MAVIIIINPWPWADKSGHVFGYHWRHGRKMTKPLLQVNTKKCQRSNRCSADRWHSANISIICSRPMELSPPDDSVEKYSMRSGQKSKLGAEGSDGKKFEKFTSFVAVLWPTRICAHHSEWRMEFEPISGSPFFFFFFVGLVLLQLEGFSY